MAFFLKHRGKKPGSSPGTVHLVGERKLQQVHLSEISYGPEAAEEKQFATIDECLASKPTGPVRWINVDGLHDPAVIRRLGEAFQIHSLTLEDITNTNQRPKAEPHEEYIYVVLKLFSPSEGTSLEAEQMSFLLKKNLVISFQEREGDVFDEVRNRIRSGHINGIRFRGADYLLYSLIDAIVDHYFVVLEKIGDEIEETEEELMHGPTRAILEKIYRLRRDVIALRRNIWPLRELLSALVKKDNPFFEQGTNIFLADVYDHAIEILDLLEGDRELLSGMIDLYQSRVGNRLNEIMKVLTIIATLFIPPTFVAGVYGMNFENMPEIHTRLGYFVVLGVMLASIGGMLVYFRRKKWL